MFHFYTYPIQYVKQKLQPCLLQHAFKHPPSLLPMQDPLSLIAIDLLNPQEAVGANCSILIRICSMRFPQNFSSKCDTFSGAGQFIFWLSHRLAQSKVLSRNRYLC
jgi:hypothetical protein